MSDTGPVRSQVAVGQRLRSQVCTTEVIVIRASADVPLPECGGHPMVGPHEQPGPASTLDPAWSAGSLLGKRYVADGVDLELLVVKAGEGSLAVAGVPLQVKAAKALPSSD